MVQLKKNSDFYKEVYLLILATAFMFFAPLTSSGKTLLILLLLFAVLGFKAFRLSFLQQLKQPIVILAYGLYVLLVLACLWSPASISQQLLMLNKYSKLLLLPVFIVAFLPLKNRKIGILAFLAAVFLTGLLAILQKYGWVNLHGNGQADPAFVFQSHIMTSFLFSFAAFFSFCIYMNKSELRSHVFYLFLTLFFSYCVFFVNIGRTGYFIYLLLALFFSVRYFSLKIALLACLICLSGFSFIYWQSPLMKKNINALYYSYQHYQQQKKDTSLGFRIQFHEFAGQIVKKSPWFGEGTGSFAYWYEKEKPIQHWNEPLREPHSEYWLFAVQTGIFGLLALLSFFALFFYMTTQLKKSSLPAQATLLAFMAGCASDSLLFYGGPGYFFIAFVALFSAELGRGFSLSFKKYGRVKKEPARTATSY